MNKTLKHAKYAAMIVLLLIVPAVFYPQTGMIGLAASTIYLAAGAIVYLGYAHIGKTTKSRLLENTSHMMVAFILLFAAAMLIGAAAQPTEEGTPKEIVLTMMLLQTVYGLTTTGLGVSIFPLKERLGKTATAAAILYTTAGLLYSMGWGIKTATLVTDALPAASTALATVAIRTTTIIAMAAQIATILFLHKAEKKLTDETDGRRKQT